MALQFRRGTAAEVTSESLVPAVGEPVFVTDTNKLFVGDGATLGGVEVGATLDVPDLTSVDLITEEVRTINAFEVTSNVATVNLTTGTTKYFVGLQVTISGSTTAALNGTHTILSLPTASQFTFSLTQADTANTVTDGTVTPVLANERIIAYNSTSSKWEDKDPATLTAISGQRLSSMSDVDTYNTATTGVQNPDIGKVIKYDYDQNWSVVRPGETIDFATNQNYFGLDFASGLNSVYTANTSLWTQSGTSNLLSGQTGSVPAEPPYGDAVEHSDDLIYTPTGTLTDSDDFTISFWLWREDVASNDWNDGVHWWTGTTRHLQITYDQDNGTTSRVAINTRMFSDDTVGSTLQQWCSWIVTSNNDQWVHIAIARQGSDLRLWFNGGDEGNPDNFGAGRDADQDLRFDLIDRFMPSRISSIDNYTGPVFFDLSKAHFDPSTAADINVPVEREDPYKIQSGINVNELSDTSYLAPGRGDSLHYHQGVFQYNRPLYAMMRYNLGTAPTSTTPIANSEKIGAIASLGTFVNYDSELRFTETNGEGPASAQDNPTLRPTFSSTFPGQFQSFPRGVYRIDISCSFIHENLPADTVVNHSLTLNPVSNSVNCGSRYHWYSLTTGSTSPAAVFQTISFSHVFRFTEDFGGSVTTPGANHFELELDSEQSSLFYVGDAYIGITKLG